MTVIILAAGEQERWEIQGGLKQLVSIGQESVMPRIIRQSINRGVEPIIATHKTELALCGNYNYYPEERRWISETLFSTRWLWSEQNIILLGDVVYSKRCMDDIFAYNGDIQFWGNEHEIFALGFSGAVVGKLCEAIKRVIEYADNTNVGTLRKLFLSYVGYSLNINTTDHKVFHCIDPTVDYTNDIDTDEERHNFIREVVNTRRLDDL